MGINLYAYVGNNPINLTDPLGLMDSVTASLNKAIASGNAAEIQLILETGGLNAAQAARATQAVTRLMQPAQQYIGQYCKASINREFPKQLLQQTGKEILDAAKSGDKIAQKALKLMTDTRFAK